MGLGADVIFLSNQSVDLGVKFGFGFRFGFGFSSSGFNVFVLNLHGDRNVIRIMMK